MLEYLIIAASTASAAAQGSPPSASVMGLPFGWAAIFSILNLVLGGGAITMWLSKRAENKKVNQDGDTQLRSEMWQDIANLKLSKEAMSTRLTLAETQIAGQTIRLGQQAFIINLLLDEIERISPGNSVARTARALLRQQADQMPNAEEIAPMADILGRMCEEDPEAPNGRS